MRTKRVLYGSIVVVGLALFLAVSRVGMSAPQYGAQATNGAVRIDNDDIGGVVTSAKGPEAGVWVIAETTDLPTGSAAPWSPMIAGATCCRTFPKRATKCGRAATAWWIPPRSSRPRARL